MKLPALWLGMAFGTGVISYRMQHAGPRIWLVISASVIFAGLIFLWRDWQAAAWVASLLAWTWLGVLAMTIEPMAVPPNHVTRLIASGKLDTTEPLRWRGILRDDPMELPWGRRYEITLDVIEIEGHERPVTGGLRVNLFRPPRGEELAVENLRAGDCVEALVRARPPRNFLDPGAFDARGFLARQGIDVIGTLRSRELLQRVGTPPLGLSHRMARARGNLNRKLDSLFSGQPQRAAILRAMLLGDRTFVDSDIALAFQKTGAYHVLVVAGLHVAALTFFVFWLSKRLRLPLWARSLLTLSVLASYVGVVQERPPILRAALVASFFLFARLLFRRIELLNLVGLAALVLLIAKPSSLSDASFQLSFLAAGVIAGLALPWIERTSAACATGLEHLGDVTRDAVHPPKIAQFRIDLRAVAARLSQRLPQRLASRAEAILASPVRFGIRLWEIALLSAAIQWGMLPLMAVYFHRVSLSGPASNIPAVLLTGLIVPLGFLGLAASYLWNPLALLIAKLVGILVGLLVASTEWFSRLPRLSYRIPGPPGLLLATFFVTLVCLSTLARSSAAQNRGRAETRLPRQPLRLAEWSAAVMLALLTFATASYPFAPGLKKGFLEITVLDVGQGDSIFAAFPDGRTMLIDGGGQAGAERMGGYRTGIDVGEQVVSPYLWSRGLKRVDVVALTHAHHDHLDGLHAVLQNFHIGQLWVARDVETSAYRQLLAEANALRLPVLHELDGSKFNWSGVDGRVLWPEDPSPAPAGSNNDSIVLRLSDGPVRFLLTGDIEQKVESELVTRNAPLDADFLKVPHHGSKTSSTEGFLAAVKPRIAVISVGEGNPLGHPYPTVVARYLDSGVHLFRTDRDGALTALTDGKSLSVTTFVGARGN